VSTPTLPPTGKPIESTVDPTDPTSRSEVCLVVSDRPLEPAVIFVTKYCGREVGERSVGQHPDIADEFAAMLRAAASLARTQQPETTLNRNVDTR
jgi:catechol 2,3-dioxygenase-like lactoylglutathione lyase family enzyme